MDNKKYSDVPRRAATAFTGIFITLICLYYPALFAIESGILVYVALREWWAIKGRIVQRLLLHPSQKPLDEVSMAELDSSSTTRLKCFAGALVTVCAHFGSVPFSFALYKFFILLFIFFLFNYQRSTAMEAARKVSANVQQQDRDAPFELFVCFLDFVLEFFGVFWVNGLGQAVLLRNISDVGIVGLFLVLFCNWACDAVSLFVGRSRGRTQLCALSPKKTMEGSVAGCLASVVASILIYFIAVGIFRPVMGLGWYTAMGAYIGVVGIFGDLIESFFKRVSKVKDSGNFFPGHGGVLDRLDGLTFAFPCMFWVVQWMS